MTEPRILIVGAGLGGLSAAACLLQAGFDVAVYEQAPELGEIGAGIQTSANAMHVMRHLGLEAAIEAIAVRPAAYEFRLAADGEMIQAFPLAAEHEARHGAPYFHLHRADFHDILAARVKALKGDAIHLDHAATGFRADGDGVTLSFANRAPARGDLLIGADGIKSVIRPRLTGDVAATYTGDNAWRITVPVDRLPADFLDRTMTVWMGPGAHAVTYFIRGGALLNFVGIVESDRWSEESWTAKYPWTEFKADFAGWTDKIQTLIDAADRDQCYRWALHIREPIRTWCTDRVALLGDAIHPTLPYLAQGAAMAIEDGMVLTRALAHAGPGPAALDLYQRNRAERCARIVRESSANGRLFHNKSVAELKSAFAQRDMGAERNAWLYSYNPVTVELT